jgi:hypothetical protein
MCQKNIYFAFRRNVLAAAKKCVGGYKIEIRPSLSLIIIERSFHKLNCLKRLLKRNSVTIGLEIKYLFT